MKTLPVRFTDQEHKAIAEQAHKAGIMEGRRVSMAEYVRRAVRFKLPLIKEEQEEEDPCTSEKH
jgi:Arc/MetJ-type ribon-helix-helix transcriptional regulator